MELTWRDNHSASLFVFPIPNQEKHKVHGRLSMPILTYRKELQSFGVIEILHLVLIPSPANYQILEKLLTFVDFQLSDWQGLNNYTCIPILVLNTKQVNNEL